MRESTVSCARNAPETGRLNPLATSHGTARSGTAYGTTGAKEAVIQGEQVARVRIRAAYLAWPRRRSADMRAILLDQNPSLVSVPALGNTGLTVCLNLKHADDVEAAGKALTLPREQWEHIGRLPVGQGIVKLQDRWVKPFLVQFPLFTTPDPQQGLPKSAGLEHEYWKKLTAERYRAQGYTVEEEVPIGGGKAVDLLATKDGKRIAIEIETGKSDAEGNERKCKGAGFDETLVVCTKASVPVFR